MKTILTIIGLLAVMIFAAFALARPIYAQTPCMGRADAMAMMYQRYGESIVGQGTTRRGMIIVVFANPSTRSFTMALVQGDNLCLLDDGTDWVISDPMPVGEPA